MKPGLDGYLDPAREVLALSPAQALAEVDKVRTAWDAWDRRAKRFPRCTDGHRLDGFHARTALGSARSGSFASASGPFHAFLIQAGESPSLLDVH